MNKTLRNLALVALATAPFSAFAAPKGTGTADDPYQIATAADLQECWKLTKAGEMVYFVQTADIDMAGMTEWHAFVGFDNVTYSSQVNYDGQNHVIKNFTSTSNEKFDASKNNCYNGSIFGVLNGVVKNLGVVDCNILTPQGGGAIGGYAGHGTGTAATIENVFVTGTIKGTNYLGGLVGTNANDLIIRNCFVNATVESTGYVAGIVGRLRSFEGNEFANVYAAGTVTGEKGALFVSSDKTNVAAAGMNLIAFNTGVADATIGTADLDVDVATDANRAQLIADVQEWDAFSATKVINGYPILEAFEAYGMDPGTSGIFDAAVEADAPAVYYNLQGVQVANPDNGVYIVRRGNKVTKELIRK